MKKILTIFVLSFILFSCNNNSWITPNSWETEITNKTETTSWETEKNDNVENIFTNNYKVNFKENDGITDIYILNLENNNEEKFISLENIYAYWHSEYINWKLYIIKRIWDIDSDSWTDELWSYDKDKKWTKIIDAKWIDFRVSPNWEKIVITKDNSLEVIDNSWNINSSFSSNELWAQDEYAWIWLLNWSNDSKNFWWKIYIASETNNFFEINTDSKKAQTFDISDLKWLQDDFSLNPNNWKILYSDYPTFFDKISEDEFKKTKQKINLNLYDFNTKTNENIASSITKKFNPKWINNTTIEYNATDWENRIATEI